MMLATDHSFIVWAVREYNIRKRRAANAYGAASERGLKKPGNDADYRIALAEEQILRHVIENWIMAERCRHLPGERIAWPYDLFESFYNSINEEFNDIQEKADAFTTPIVEEEIIPEVVVPASKKLIVKFGSE